MILKAQSSGSLIGGKINNAKSYVVLSNQMIILSTKTADEIADELWGEHRRKVA